MANVERNTAIPLYLQIAEDIKSKIKKEELKAVSYTHLLRERKVIRIF